jgi:acetyltransferase-like isoleucine patch superfamily enzyme
MVILGGNVKNNFFFVLDKLISLFRPIAYFVPNFVFVFLYDLLTILPTLIGVLFRYIIFKLLVKDSGSNIYIGRYVTFKHFQGLSVGDNVSFHECCYIDAIGQIKIGSDVSIAHNSSIISFEHTYFETHKPIKYNPLVTKSIEISSDVWIGCGVRILAGSNIGPRTIIAAGSVVKGNISSNAIYAGVPAKIKKSI